MLTVQDYALSYISRGWAAIPLRASCKYPTIKGWPDLRITASEVNRYFARKCNVGVVLGKASGWLVDVDLDCPEAIELAPKFLPVTGAVFGRPSAPRSHWLYVAPFAEPMRINDAQGACVVELRSSNQQTMFPGSTHPCGELVAWELDGAPAAVDTAELRQRVEALAAAVEAMRRAGHARRLPSRMTGADSLGL